MVSSDDEMYELSSPEHIVREQCERLTCKYAVRPSHSLQRTKPQVLMQDSVSLDTCPHQSLASIGVQNTLCFEFNSH